MVVLFAAPEDKLHYDCSKLDQWQDVFDHVQRLGLYLHFKMQENLIDDNRLAKAEQPVPASLAGGCLPPPIGPRNGAAVSLRPSIPP